MPELGEQLARYIDGIAPPIDLEEVTVGPPVEEDLPANGSRRPWLAVAAGVAAIVVVGGLLIVMRRGDSAQQVTADESVPVSGEPAHFVATYLPPGYGFHDASNNPEAEFDTVIRVSSEPGFGLSVYSTDDLAGPILGVMVASDFGLGTAEEVAALAAGGWTMAFAAEVPPPDSSDHVTINGEEGAVAIVGDRVGLAWEQNGQVLAMIADGLEEQAVVDAAQSVRLESDKPPTIAGDVPEGLTLRESTSDSSFFALTFGPNLTLPDTAAVQYADPDQSNLLTVSMAAGAPEMLDTVRLFDAAAEPIQIRGTAGIRGSYSLTDPQAIDSIVWVEQNTIVMANMTGLSSDEALRFVEGLEQVDADEWASLLDRPSERGGGYESSTLAYGLILEAPDHTWRIEVGASQNVTYPGTPVKYEFTAQFPDGSGHQNTFEAEADLQVYSAVFPPAVLYGSVAPDVDRVVVTTATGDQIAAEPGPPLAEDYGEPGTFPVKFFAIEVPGGEQEVTVTAFDAAGREIARQRATVSEQLQLPFPSIPPDAGD